MPMSLLLSAVRVGSNCDCQTPAAHSSRIDHASMSRCCCDRVARGLMQRIVNGEILPSRQRALAFCAIATIPGN